MLAEQYLAIEHVRYGDRLRVRIDAAEEARSCLVPQLMLQPLVENAVRHGISPVETGGMISVAAGLVESRLRVSVSDDGVGLGDRRKSRSTGVGLSAVRAALNHLYGDDQRLVIQRGEEGGTVVVIDIPVRRRSA
jgi:two-component system, LytTR family, sensor kinase